MLCLKNSYRHCGDDAKVKTRQICPAPGVGGMVTIEWCIVTREVNLAAQSSAWFWFPATLQLILWSLVISAHNHIGPCQNRPMTVSARNFNIDILLKRFLGIPLWHSFSRMHISLAVNTSANSMAVYIMKLCLYSGGNGLCSKIT